MDKASVIRDNVFADCIIDADEVRQLEESMYSNGSISMEHAVMLFEINDAVTGNANAPEWEEFFIRAVSDAVLEESSITGGLDTDSVEFLVEHILADDEIDHAERALLLHIRNTTTSVTPELDEELINLGVLTTADVV